MSYDRRDMSGELATEIAPRARRPRKTSDARPNATLSARDVQLLLRELKNYACRIALLRDPASRSEQRHVRELVEKLHQVRS